jgi:hypothetical protein
MFLGGVMQNIYSEILKATKHIQVWAEDCESNFNEFFYGQNHYGQKQMKDLDQLKLQDIRCAIEIGLDQARNNNLQTRQHYLGQCLIVFKSVEKAIQQLSAIDLYESFWELHMLCECAAEEEFYLHGKNN